MSQTMDGMDCSKADAQDVEAACRELHGRPFMGEK